MASDVPALQAKPEGICLFTGIDVNNIMSGSFTYSHGITPSTAQIEMRPQEGFNASEGTLSFLMVGGDGGRVDFHDCKIANYHFEASSNGFIWRLTIQDKRWRWKFGEIYGCYNRRLCDDSLDPLSIKSPRELATLCIEAMQEVGDVSRLPDDSRPFVDWDGANPAKCLDSLVHSLGCRVVLNIAGIVEIWPTGAGAQLPGGKIMSDSLSIKVALRPDKIRVLGGRSRFQQDFVLEAVGLDTDGSIKPINKLSYSEGSWLDDVHPFKNVRKVYGQKAQELAIRTVWRWYRIKCPFILKGYGPIKTHNQIEPIEAEQIATWIDPVDKRVKPKPVELFGRYADNEIGAGGVYKNFGLSAGNVFYDRKFELHPDVAVVEFKERIFLWHQHGYAKDIFDLDGATAADLEFYPAELKLRTTVCVRHQNGPDKGFENNRGEADARGGTNFAWVRWVWDLDEPNPHHKTGPQILKHDEIVASFIDGVQINYGDCVQESNYYLKAADVLYQTTEPQVRKYAGIKVVDLDGAIQQVHWEVGQGGATTTASRDTEFSLDVPPYPHRRLHESLRDDTIAKVEREIDGRLKIEYNRSRAF